MPQPSPTTRSITISVPSPRAVVAAVRGAVLWSLDATELVVSLPARAESLLTQVDILLARVGEVTEEAALVVKQVEATSTTANTLVGELEPIADKALPLGRVFVDNFSQNELTAAIKMVDYLPELLRRMDALVPVLAQLDSVAPELHQLLDVTKDVRRAVIGIPGFKFFRNRGDNILDGTE